MVVLCHQTDIKTVCQNGQPHHHVHKSPLMKTSWVSWMHSVPSYPIFLQDWF